MNIAIFSPNQNPYSETFIQAHKQFLKGTIFYYYGNKHSIKLEGAPSLVSKAKALQLRFIRKLTKKPFSNIIQKGIVNSLRKNKIDAILVEYGNHAHHLLPVLVNSGIPFVVHFHGYDASSKDVIERCNNYKAVFEQASKIIAVSKQMERVLLDMGCPKNKLVYNVCGPRPEFYKISPAFSKQQFISVGRFVDKKAPYYTIMAFNEVAQTYPNARLLMAGDGPLLNTCKNLVAYLGLTKQVEFLGVISADDYCDLLSESLAFVQHSVTALDGDMEGTPVSILEASAAGLPVISTYHAGIPDVIIHGETGFLCEEHDVQVMAQNMLTLLKDVDYAKQLGSAGKQHIKANFSIDRHIDVLNTIIYKLGKNRNNTI